MIQIKCALATVLPSLLLSSICYGQVSTNVFSSPYPPSVIMVTHKAASQRMLAFLERCNLQNLVEGQFSDDKVKVTLGRGQYSYHQSNPYLDLTLSGMTGDIALDRFNYGLRADGIDVGMGRAKFSAPQPPNKDDAWRALNFLGIPKNAWNFAWYSENDTFQFLLLQKDGSPVFTNDIGVKLLTRFEINRIEDSIYIAKIPNINPYRTLSPPITFDQALSLANYLILGEVPVTANLIETSQFSPKQKERWLKLYKGLDDYTHDLFAPPSVQVRRDTWMLLRLEWILRFGEFDLKLDAITGQPKENDYARCRGLAMSSSSDFLSATLQVHSRPQWYKDATDLEFAKVDFNQQQIDSNGLHYPPIIRQNAALIFADYFPNFLIETKREGDTITLRGQLKKTGKTAILKIGSTEATVDGEKVTLSGAPEEIDGRLYLPAELLQLTNGVLVRWEPKNKLLYVDTRFLRRDD